MSLMLAIIFATFARPAHAGVPVLQFGRLAKSPPVFVKRVPVNREDTFRDRNVESRLTHITVETRLVRRADHREGGQL